MRWVSSIGGVIATGAAIAVLVSLPTRTQAPDAASLPIDVSPPVEPVVQDVVLEQPVEHDMSVAGLGSDLVGVLAEGGYTRFVGAEELSEVLSEDVVQVLISEETVLVIPSEEGS